MAIRKKANSNKKILPKVADIFKINSKKISKYI